MKKNIIGIFVLCILSMGAYAQSSTSDQYLTTMNFLTIGTDARTAAMANTGLVSSPDINSHYSNPAKYIFDENNAGISAFYSPWMSKTSIKDMGLYALSGFYKFDSLQTISSSFRYFSLGKVDYVTGEAQPAGSFNSYEMAFDVAYARKLSQSISAALTMRYSYSKMASNSGVNQQNYKGGQAVAADLSVYYLKPITMMKMPTNLSFALALTNIGTKVSYSGDKSYFLPAQLKFGVGLSSALDKNNKLAVLAHLQKCLAPANPEKVDDSSLAGIFSSFSDGMPSVQWSFGAEYDYKDIVKARFGYLNESKSLGNRSYLSFGLGGKYKSIGLDVAYFAPLSMSEHPMANTIQISLSVGFPWTK